MAEAAVEIPAAAPTPATPTLAAPAPAPLLAGKYKDQPSLEKGIREGSTRAGLDALPGGDLIGDGKPFASVEAAERYYKAIDKVIASTPKPGSEPKGEVAPLKIGGDPLPETATIPDIIAKAGLKMPEVIEQYTKHGDLTDEQVKAIRAIRPGWSKADIKFMADGLQAKAALRQQAIGKVQTDAAAAVGGMDNLKTLLDQAKVFVPEAERAGIDAMLDNPATAVAAVRVLKQMHADHIGAGGSQTTINGSAGQASSGPKTLSEYKELVRRAQGGEDRLWEIIGKIDANTLSLT